MGISRYPRPGHRLAPATLRKILNVPVPKYLVRGSDSNLKLCDLDETVWDRFDLETCRKLAKEVKNIVRLHVPSRSREVLNLRLPTPPKGISLKTLALETRTYLLLRRWGFEDILKRGKGITIGELLDIHGFGVSCLVDLLTSLETAIGKANREQSSALRQFQVTEEASFRPRKFKQGNPLRDPILTAGIKKLQQISEAKHISRDDPRLGHLLRTINPEIETASDLTNRLTYHKSFSKLAITRVWDLEERIKAFSQLPLEDELTQIIAALCPNRRNVRVATQRFDFDGEGKRTLKAIADKFGITRERVRQICIKITNQIKETHPFAPVLHNAIVFVSSHTPDEATEIEKGLAAAGLSRRAFRLEGLIAAADMLEYEVPFIIIKKHGTRLVVAVGAEKAVSLLPQLAAKAMRHWGAATIADIAAQVEDRHQLHVEPSFVVKVLQAQEGFSWLDEEHGWFWISSSSTNRLLSSFRKILSVAGEIKISEVRRGLSRNYRTEGFAPPQRVLLALCNQLPWCRVENNIVIADPSIDWTSVFSGEERTIVEILKEHGPIMRREDLEKLCLEKGMKRSTVYAYLGYLPVIAKYGQGVYGLRGAKIQPGEVDSLIPRRKPGKVIIDDGWMKDGHIWIVIRLSRTVLSSGVFGCPARWKPLLKGNFTLKTVESARIGTLVVGENGTWGLGPFFNRRGGELGDYLSLVFDLKHREVTINIGDDGILEDFH